MSAECPQHRIETRNDLSKGFLRWPISEPFKLALHSRQSALNEYGARDGARRFVRMGHKFSSVFSLERYLEARGSCVEILPCASRVNAVSPFRVPAHSCQLRRVQAARALLVHDRTPKVRPVTPRWIPSSNSAYLPSRFCASRGPLLRVKRT